MPNIIYSSTKLFGTIGRLELAAANVCNSSAFALQEGDSSDVPDLGV